MTSRKWTGARVIAGWGGNVFVQIPVTNTAGESSASVVQDLSPDGITVNDTALMTLRQVRVVSEALAGGALACASVFAGRTADTGRDPVPLTATAMEILRDAANAEPIWASPRGRWHDKPLKLHPNPPY